MARQYDTRSTRLDGLRATAERRAALARAAHDAVGATHAHARAGRWQDVAAVAAWHESIAKAHALASACYPRDFWDAFDELKARSAKPNSIETAILFLEEDAMFFRSGYVKARTVQRLLRQNLDREQTERLGDVVLGVVDRRSSQEFRRYCRLAVRVATPALREALDARSRGADPNVAARARWVLEALARD